MICTKPHEQWCLGRNPSERGSVYQVFEDECFGSLEEAEHALFLKRLKIFGITDDDK